MSNRENECAVFRDVRRPPPARSAERTLRTREPNGFGLAAVLLFLVVASVTAAVAARASLTEQVSSTALRQEGAARYAAEAGANRVWANWPSGASSLAPGDSLDLGATTLADGASYHPVITRYDGGSGQEVLSLRVTGRGPGPRGGQHALEMWATMARFPFRFAMLAKDEFEVQNNSLVDSYDSNAGPYGVGGNVGNDGDVSSNGKIEVKGGSTVKGDATAVIDIDDSGGTITGTQTEGGDPSDLPAVDCPSGGYTPGSAFCGVNYDYDPSRGLLEVEGTVLLPEGTYFFDEVKLKPNARLLPVAGDQVTVYVSKEMKLQNGAEVNSVGKKPSDFVMYGCGNAGADFRFSNHNKVYGPVYSPDFEVELSNSSEAWGAYVGWKIKVDNSSKIHWDADLFDVEGPGGPKVPVRLSRPWSQVLR